MKVLFFFQTLLELWTNVYCAWREIFGRDIKIEKCSFRLIRSIKKSNFWKFDSFIKFFRTLNEQLPCLPKKFFAGISKLKIVLYIFRISCWGWKKTFWNFCRFSFYSDLGHNCFGFEATEFSPSLSKMQSTCLYEFSLRCWY